MWHREQQRKKADTCPGCGGSLSDTTDADNEDAYVGHVLRCHACKARESAVERMKDDPHRSSLLVWAKSADEEEGG
jgi:hypothetical protein